MAKQRNPRLPTRTTQPGKGPAQKQPPIVGYGLKGGAFHNAAKYEKSKAAQKAGGHLNTNPGFPQQSHTPMPGHPSQNPTSYHGPSTTGSIKPGAVKAPRMK